MWISGPTEGLENIFLLLQSTSNPDKRVYVGDSSRISVTATITLIEVPTLSQSHTQPYCACWLIFSYFAPSDQYKLSVVAIFCFLHCNTAGCLATDMYPAISGMQLRLIQLLYCNLKSSSIIVFLDVVLRSNHQVGEI